MSEQNIAHGLYGSIFNEPCAEINFLEIIQSSNSPIVDLRPIREAYKSDGKTRLPEIALKPFLELDAEKQGKVIFIANKSDIDALIKSVPSAKSELLQNSSIMQIMSEE